MTVTRPQPVGRRAVRRQRDDGRRWRLDAHRPERRLAARVRPRRLRRRDRAPRSCEAARPAKASTPRLHRDQPHAGIDGGPFTFVLTEGRTGERHGDARQPRRPRAISTFATGEVDLGGPRRPRSPASARAHARLARPASTRTPGPPRAWGTKRRARVPPRIAADGDVLASWPTGMTCPWGVAVQHDGDVWLSDPEDVIDARFTTAGERAGRVQLDDWVGDWGADMAFDADRGLIWQVNVGGDNGIYGLDPGDGSVEQSRSPARRGTGISQRGLAYDPDADVFYIGGWNEGIVYRVAGLSHPTPGETLNQCNPADAGASPGWPGTARSGCSGSRPTPRPTTSGCSIRSPAKPCGASRIRTAAAFNGAGLELDAVGNLWTVGQNSGNAYLDRVRPADLQRRAVADRRPDRGDRRAGRQLDIDRHGRLDRPRCRASIGRSSSSRRTTPTTRSSRSRSSSSCPPTSRASTRVAGASTNANGDAFAADRAYGAGPFGYVGSSSTRSHRSADRRDRATTALYQDLRTGMTELPVRRAGRHVPGRPPVRRDRRSRSGRPAQVRRQHRGRRRPAGGSTCAPPPAARTSRSTGPSW